MRHPLDTSKFRKEFQKTIDRLDVVSVARIFLKLSLVETSDKADGYLRLKNSVLKYIRQ
jgi:hypothetical protein